jgi:hypothetical protein
MTADALLQDLAQHATTNRENGDLLESLMVKFLSVDSQWSARFSKVTKWGEWEGGLLGAVEGGERLLVPGGGGAVVFPRHLGSTDARPFRAEMTPPFGLVAKRIMRF